MEIFGGLSEPVLRLSVFAGVFAIMALLEFIIPRRKLVASKGRRWFTNGVIIGLDSLLVRLMSLFVVPLVAVAAAIYAETQGIGLFNWIGLPVWLEIVAAVIILDFAIWLQHVLSHKIPILWRVHQMHHSDRDIDVTTGLRFHPIEIGLSMLYKIAWVFLLGPAAVAVVLFEVILNGSAMFNHANVKLPLWLDRIIRLVLVTPDMHRVHHSIIRREHDTNYGFAMSIWDRMFGTYTDQPSEGHDGMTIGLAAYQHDGPTQIGWSLNLPIAGFPKGGTSTPSAGDAKAQRAAGDAAAE